LSADGVLDGRGETLLRSLPHSGALGAGGSYTSSFTFTVPAGYEGSLFLIVELDAADTVREGPGEADNGTQARELWVTAAAAREVVRSQVPASSYQAVFERFANSGYRPVWVDGYDVNGQTFYNAVFRPADGVEWVARHGLTSAQYQAEFDAQVRAGFR